LFMQPDKPRSHYTPSPPADVVDESEQSKRKKTKRASKPQQAQSKPAKSKRVTEPKDAWKPTTRVLTESARLPWREPVRETGPRPWGTQFDPSRYERPVITRPGPPEPQRYRQPPRPECRDLLDLIDLCLLRRLIR
jgi:hypothetical protein